VILHEHRPVNEGKIRVIKSTKNIRLFRLVNDYVFQVQGISLVAVTVRLIWLVHTQ